MEAKPGAEQPSYHVELAHDHNGVAERVRQCILEMKSCHSVLKQMAAVEIVTSRKHMKLLAGEHPSPALSGKPIRSMHGAWDRAKKTMSKAAANRIASAQQLTEEVIDPLYQYNLRAERTFREIMGRQLIMKKKLDGKREALKANLAAAQKLLVAAKEAKKESDQARPDKELGAGGWLTSKLASKFNELTGSTYPELQKKCHQTLLAYREDIEQLNTLQHAMLHEETPTALRALDTLDRERMLFWQEILVKLGDIHKQATLPNTELYSTFLDVVSSVDTVDELQGFISIRLEKHPAPTEPADKEAQGYERYRMPVTPADVQAGRLTRHPLSPFHCELPELISSQHTSMRGIEVPAVVLALLHAIRTTGGLNTEGIFRLTDERERLAELHNLLDTGELFLSRALPCPAPHAYAVVLKRWFRQIPTPLVPAYDDALATALAFKTALPTGSDDDFKAMAVEAMELMRPVARRTIAHLIAMMREVASPAHTGTNRMTLSTLAVLFGPNLLRNPRRDATHAKDEALFVQLLFQHAVLPTEALAADVVLFEACRSTTTTTPASTTTCTPAPTTISTTPTPATSTSAPTSTTAFASTPSPASTSANTVTASSVAEAEPPPGDGDEAIRELMAAVDVDDANEEVEEI